LSLGLQALYMCSCSE